MKKLKIKITRRPPVSREHGLDVDQEYAAVYVDPPEARHARIQITARDSGAPVCLEWWEWEEIDEWSKQEAEKTEHPQGTKGRPPGVP